MKRSRRVRLEDVFYGENECASKRSPVTTWRFTLLFVHIPPRLGSAWLCGTDGHRASGQNLSRRTGVYCEHRAGNIARAVAKQKFDRAGHVAHLGETAQCAAADDALTLFAGKTVRHFGFEEAGRNGVHVDAEPADLARERA